VFVYKNFVAHYCVSIFYAVKVMGRAIFTESFLGHLKRKGWETLN